MSSVARKKQRKMRASNKAGHYFFFFPSGHSLSRAIKKQKIARTNAAYKRPSTSSLDSQSRPISCRQPKLFFVCRVKRGAISAQTTNHCRSWATEE